MTTRQLPQDVISLVHHVHLNQEGWWKKGVSQVLAGLLWKAGKPMSGASIQKELSSQLNVSMGLDEIAVCLNSLAVANVVSEIKAGEFKLSEQSNRELTKSATEGEAELNRAKAYFYKEVEARCGSSLPPDEVWNAFLSELTAAVKQTGANTFNLLVGDSLTSKEDWLIGFVQKFGADHVACLKAVVAGFFSAENPEGNQYVLRLMTAYFFVEATQLSRRTIEGIDAKRSQRKLHLYLDTNFLFSVLGLHDNPADDAAVSLLSLAQAARPYIDIKFLVLPHTLDETQRTVMGLLSAAKQIQVSRALQSAATGAPIPSALIKFFNASSNAQSPLTPDDFFGPYAKNLKTILERKGITVAEDIDISSYRLDQRVIDDVLPLFNKESGRVWGKPRTYEGIEHDVILWYAVNDLRAQHIESPFDAESWVVTVDNWLISFDRQKTPSQLGVPTALLPSSLAQLMQFWVPRSDQLEATLLDSLKLPLFFRQFDREDERVTMRILGALSRYRDVDDLGVDAVRDILVSDALRQRLVTSTEASDDEVFKLVENEIIQKQKQLGDTLSVTEAQLITAQDKASSSAEKLKQAEDARKEEEKARQIAESQATAAIAEKATAEQLAETEANKHVIAARERDEAQAQLAAIALKELKRQFLIRYGLGLPLFIVVSCAAIGSWVPISPIESIASAWPKIGYAVAGAFSSGVGVWHAVGFLKRQPTLSDWWVSRHVQRLSAGAFVFFGSGVLPGYVGDFLKKLVGLS